MSLSLALNTALSGLNVSQRALAVVSNNIANANTVGYSKQVVEQSAVYIDSVGMGVKIENVSRKVDQYLERALVQKGSDVGRTSTVTSYTDRIQNLLGAPGDTNSLDEYVGNFFNNIQALAESPDRISFRENAVDSAIVLAGKVSNLASGLQDLRYQADQDMQEAVRTLNTQLKTIDSLNIAISQAKMLGKSIAGLQDQLDVAVSKVASYIDIQTTPQQSGGLFIYTSNGASLVDDSAYQFRYRGGGGTLSIEQGTPFPSLDIVRLNFDGSDSTDRFTLITAGTSENVASSISNGALYSLQQLRDRSIPDILTQIDTLAANLRDSFNAIHNDGSSYPGTNVLSGTRSVSAQDRSDWTGTVTIAVLDAEGRPLSSPYPDESHTGIRPLTLDLSKLESGFGEGKPTNQTIIDEINNHFGPPPVKAKLGNLNNIQLVSNTTALPDSPPQFVFDFDLDNISKDPAQFFVGGITVLDDQGMDISNVTSTAAKINLTPAQTFTTIANGTGFVEVRADTTGLKNGDLVYLGNPGIASIDGITAAQLTGYFRILNVTDGSFQIETAGSAITGVASVNAPAATATASYSTAIAGTEGRTKKDGVFTANLAGNAGSAYYDITVSVGVNDGKTGAAGVAQGTITYRIYNGQPNLLNDRFHTAAASGDVNRVPGGTSQPSLIAKMVDANGKELPKANGAYVDMPGFLKLETFDPNHTLAIDEGDSKQLGDSLVSTSTRGTGRGFSHYFELNNFFESNAPNATGDVVKGTALTIEVEQRIKQNASLISLGSLVRTSQPVDTNQPARYTLERANAENDVIQRLAQLGLVAQKFEAAGGLDPMTTSFGGYTGEILGFLASKAAQADSAATDAQTLYDGFAEQLDAMKGVNIDEELANTIIYQHAYSASARVISVTSELFDTLLGIN